MLSTVSTVEYEQVYNCIFGYTKMRAIQASIDDIDDSELAKYVKKIVRDHILEIDTHKDLVKQFVPYIDGLIFMLLGFRTDEKGKTKKNTISWEDMLA